MPRADKRFRTLLICAPLLLAGCANPFTRSDDLWPWAGDAVAANRLVQTINPWPRESRDTAFPANGARIAEAMRDYKTGKKIEAPPPAVLVTR
ncbi:MAG: hypothetical protein H6871_11725 [Methylobacteriaceae bacterium]|nr:hypothetical protein [Methylobacteriaceae bacterium]